MALVKRCSLTTAWLVLVAYFVVAGRKIAFFYAQSERKSTLAQAALLAPSAGPSGSCRLTPVILGAGDTTRLRA